MIVETYNYASPRNRIAMWSQVWRARTRRKFAGEIALLEPFIRPGGCYLDIGGNHGRFALELSRVHGGSGRVYSFEPMPYNQRVLERTVRGRKNVVVVETGLSNENATRDFYVPIRPNGTLMHGSAQLAHPGPAGSAGGLFENCLHLTVEVRRLDGIAERLRIGPVDFIKMDVQGHERHVLEGGVETLRKSYPTIMMEGLPQSDDRLMESTPKPIEAGHGHAAFFLEELGYQFFDLDLREDGRWHGSAKEIVEGLGRAKKAHDILCWHPEGPQPGSSPPEFGAAFLKTRFGT